MHYQKLSFVIPVYNEEETLEDILSIIMSTDLGIEKEIVMVNDGSRDRSPQIMDSYKDRAQFVVLHNSQNLGKSQTVKKGIMATTGDLVVIQDADLEYDPHDLKQFVELFQQGSVDLVYGNRFGKDNKVIYWQNWIGNTFLSFVSAVFTGLRAGMWTRDMETCYKMAKGDVFREVGGSIISTSMFGLEPEMTAKFSKYKLGGKHLRFQQVPISYFPRTISEGKKMSAFKDGAKALWEIIKFNVLS